MADSFKAVVIPLPTAAAEPVANPPRGKGRTPKVVVPAYKLNNARWAREHYAVLAKISAAREVREEAERLEGLIKARAFLDAQIADVQNRIRP